MTASLVGGIPDASRAAFEADRWIRQIARSEGEGADRDALARPGAGRPGGRWRVGMASGPRPEPTEPIKRLAASGLLPPDLASKFPKGQVAALAIISIEARGGGGICDLRIDEIATRSATGPSTVQTALKTAKQLGLLTVEVRHRLPNLIRIVSPDWLAWLEKGLPR